MGEDKLKIVCPFHDDHDPSGVITLSTEKFKCNASSCARHTDLATTLAQIATKYSGKVVTRSQVLETLVRKHGMKPPGDAPLAAEPILLAHKELLDNQTADVVKAFFAKGVTVETIERYKIGLRDGRIIIPILNEYGNAWVNERRYLPNAAGADKMRNATGRGAELIYPVDQLSYKKIAVFGGETKALVALQELNKHGIGCICVTAAEGVFKNAWLKHLIGKVVYVVMDVDAAGKRAAQKLGHLFFKPAEEVIIVHLPLDATKYPKGDVNNYVVDEKQDLYGALISHGEDYKPRLSNTEDLDEGEYQKRSISESISAANVGSRSAVDVTVIGVGGERYSLPKTLRVSCTFNTESCATCNVYGKQKNPRFTLPVEHPAMISMCNATDQALDSTLRNTILGIPKKCKENVVIVEERYGVEVVIVSQPVGLEATSESDFRQVQKALVACDGVELNATVRMNVRAQPDPRTQETVLVTGNCEPIADALDEANSYGAYSLEVFQPTGDTLEDLENKLLSIADDLSCNVTNIYQRADMHIAVDLVCHSPLYMTLEDKVEKGYIEALLIGDTGQGKSECTKHLSKHYGVGHIVDCGNVSVAGLLGGAQELAGMWVTTWGAWPKNDRRWLILEELKEAQEGVLSALKQTRTSGIASIQKISAGTKNARARLLAISNTKSNRFLRTYGSGVNAVLELIGQPENVRRFDFCYAVSADDIQGDVIHASTRPTAEHLLSSHLCHRLITWVWTREAQHVVFAEPVKDLLMQYAQELSNDYVDTIPIIDRGTIRLKLARIAAAIACRTYSTTDGENVLLEQRHVQCAYNFLKRIYDGDAMGYKRYSERHKATAHMTPEKAARVVDIIQRQPYARTIADYLTTRDFINIDEIRRLGAMDRDSCETLLSVLARNSGIEQKASNLIVTGALREVLRKTTEDTFKDGGDY